MDLLSHYLQSIKIRSTSVSEWLIHRPFGVDVAGFTPGYFLSVIGGEPISIESDGDVVELRTGDSVMMPNGQASRFGISGPCQYLPINELPWQGMDNKGFDIHSPPETALKVVVGDHGPSSRLIGIAFALDFPEHAKLGLFIPPKIVLRKAYDSLFSDMHPALASILNDKNPGYVALATGLAEFIVMGALRTFILNQDNYPMGPLRALKDVRLQRVILKLYQDFRKDWDIQKLAELANMSRSRFIARFVDLIGETPMQYLASIRVQHAQRLLLETTRPMSEISTQVGFNSDRVFRATFQRVTGFSPREFRGPRPTRPGE